MKATEQYFPVVLFIMLYKVVRTFESVDEILKCYHSNESYWAVLSCGAVYYAVQSGSNFWVCGWNPKVCHRSNESYWAVLSCGVVYYAVQGGSKFWVCGWNPKVLPLKWKVMSIAVLWCCLLCCTWLSCKCKYSWVMLFCNAVSPILRGED